MKTGLLYGIVPDPDSKTRVRCVFCGTFIPKANKCIEQHTNGTKHKENMDLMVLNGISFDNQVLYCHPCKQSLSVEESVSKHINSDDHATFMQAMEDLVDGEFIDLDLYLSSEKDEVHCEVCDATIECTLPNLEEHVNNYNHRLNVCEKLKLVNGIFNVENGQEVWCKLCDLYITNNIMAILGHIDDDEQHIGWFSDMEDLIEDQDVSIEDYLSNEHETKAFCNTCQTEIMCNLKNIEEHVHSETHLNNITTVNSP